MSKVYLFDLITELPLLSVPLLFFSFFYTLLEYSLILFHSSGVLFCLLEFATVVVLG